MNRSLRLLGMATALLLVFLAVVLMSQQWLRRRTEALFQEAVSAKRLQFERALELVRAEPPPWEADFVRALGATLAANIRVLPPEAAAHPLVSAVGDPHWSFDRVFRNDANEPVAVVRVGFTPPPLTRLVSTFQRVGVLLLACALALLLVLGLAALFGWHEDRDFPRPDREAYPAVHREVNTLARLARVSAEQSTELEHERNERMRAEEDRQFQQTLLTRALEEKIRIGRDLHDGLIQSLYATGLTLQATKKLLEQDPAAARQQLDTGLESLNAGIREVRGYIAGLAPERLRQQSFGESAQLLTRALDAGRNVHFDLRIDDETAARLSIEQSTDLLQIVREAVSNGLRHGAAKNVTVRLQESAGVLCLLVHDDGAGFDPAAARKTGRGLGNMEARTHNLGGQFQCLSTAGNGTRIVVTMPAPVITPA